MLPWSARVALQCAGLLLVCTCRAQLVAPQLKTITMRDGLSSDHIQCMAVDRRAHLWIGTSDGLNRYDGRRVKVYRHGGQGSLPSDVITTLAAAPDGLLYLGTSAPYLTVLDPLADTLYNIPIPVPEFSRHGEQRVVRIHVDRRERIWVAHGARCFSRFDPRTRSFSTVEIAPPLPSPRSREVVIGIHEDDKGILWLATFRGLVRFDPERMHADPVDLHPAPGTPGAGYSFQVRGAVDDDSCLVIGTWSEGIFRIRKRDGQVRLLWPDAGHKPTFVDHMVQDMLSGPDGLAYVATIDQGLLQLDLVTGTVKHFDRSLAESHCRESNDLFTGAARLMWMGEALCIGSYTHGVAIWSARNNTVRAIQLPAHDRQEETNEVFAVHRDARSGDLLVQTHHGGVFVYDSSGTTLLRQLHRPDPARRYYQHLRLDEHRLLMGSAPHALIASLSTGRMHRPQWLKERTPCGGMIWWSRGDGRHGLWCMTGANGIHHVDTLSGACTALSDTLPELANSLGSWPWDAFTDRTGRQWFLSATTPPVVLHPDGSSEQVSGPASLAPFEVSDMAETPDGRLWFAVKHSGLAVLEPDAASIAEVKDVSATLSSRNITELVAMQDGSLWMTLPNALQHFDPATGGCRVITVVDGLPSGPINLSTAHEPLAPPLVAGTWEGFYIVRDTHTADEQAPNVHITHVLAADSVVAMNADLTSSSRIVLPYDRDRIALVLCSTNLIDQHRDVFSYRLIGSDTAWSLPGRDERINFNSLDPGAYRFEVRARTNGGAWGPPASVGFTILPPFWATWWFRSLLVVVAATLIWIVFRIVLRIRLARQRAVLERERAVLEERIRIAQDLHDDLGSGLASIGMESDLAQLELEDARARALLEKVGDGARQVSDNMRRIVWALGSGQETLGDLVAYVRGFAAELLDQRGIDLRMTAELTDPRHKLTVDERRHLLLFTKEALNNVIRHADARNVTIDIRQREGGLSWDIADDGRGFDPAVQTGMGTGSASMQARARALGAELVIHAAPGRGCRLSLRAPLTGSGVLEHGRPAHRPA